MNIKLGEQKQDREAAVWYCNESIKYIDDKLQDDYNWLRVKRFLNRSLKCTIDSMLLPLLPYSEYLQTEHWSRVRSRAMAFAKYRCQVCNAGECELHTHHRTYDRIGEERDDDVIVLCEQCHTLFHQHRQLNGATH